MSQDRNQAAEDLAPGSRGPRCSLDHARDARHNYCGTVRSPRHPDELGAVNVVELPFADGERIAFFELPGTKQCEVRRLPRVPP